MPGKSKEHLDQCRQMKIKKKTSQGRHLRTKGRNAWIKEDIPGQNIHTLRHLMSRKDILGEYGEHPRSAEITTIKTTTQKIKRLPSSVYMHKETPQVIVDTPEN